MVSCAVKAPQKLMVAFVSAASLTKTYRVGDVDVAALRGALGPEELL
jgi:hypothetical protein